MSHKVSLFIKSGLCLCVLWISFVSRLEAVESDYCRHDFRNAFQQRIQTFNFTSILKRTKLSPHTLSLAKASVEYGEGALSFLKKVYELDERFKNAGGLAYDHIKDPDVKSEIDQALAFLKFTGISSVTPDLNHIKGHLQAAVLDLISAPRYRNPHSSEKVQTVKVEYFSYEREGQRNPLRRERIFGLDGQLITETMQRGIKDMPVPVTELFENLKGVRLSETSREYFEAFEMPLQFKKLTEIPDELYIRTKEKRGQILRDYIERNIAGIKISKNNPRKFLDASAPEHYVTVTVNGRRVKSFLKSAYHDADGKIRLFVEDPYSPKEEIDCISHNLI